MACSCQLTPLGMSECAECRTAREAKKQTEILEDLAKGGSFTYRSFRSATKYWYISIPFGILTVLFMIDSGFWYAIVYGATIPKGNTEGFRILYVLGLFVGGISSWLYSIRVLKIAGVFIGIGIFIYLVYGISRTIH